MMGFRLFWPASSGSVLHRQHGVYVAWCEIRSSSVSCKAKLALSPDIFLLSSSKVPRRKKANFQLDAAEKSENFGLLKKACLSLISATGGVLLEAYTSLITGYVGPFLLSTIEWTQDHVSPMPADQQIVAQAHFFISSKRGASHSGEIMGVSLKGSDCLKQGGASEYNLYEPRGEDTYTDALLRATCRPSGKTKVTLTPRNGSPKVLFDGFIDGKTQVEFGGVEGSYEYGMLTLSYVGTAEPVGPFVPVNQVFPLAEKR
ncbi:hypothetical protein [Kushneria marisflavi]|uniref:hypothetical protein n=1 Tax=Kushneria marisflavi TaxID=157779 RepID=UPI000FF7AB60|nr:hypothetical protein [Kushneria marisflavi]RKD87384.1 hypothetical protein C8D96_0856 [Kushneria marisflavi]